MSKKNKIQWCDSTVNPTTKCNQRPGRMWEAASFSDLTRRPQSRKSWLLDLPRLIFIGHMADNFSSAISFEYLRDEVIGAVISEKGRRHQWQWLTISPHRMAEFSNWLATQGIAWPVNLWAGTSVTTKATLPQITDLAGVGDETTIRFVSVEPQWEKIDFVYHLEKLDWVIQGGESGSTEHPFDLGWAEALQEECREARVPYFLKQLGAHVTCDGHRMKFSDSHGGKWLEWPESLGVRQMPIYVARTPDKADVRRRDVERESNGYEGDSDDC
ncbi:MAG: DUF5131 family protein [Planctomycetes bacterium]|nr:DUF5131 family protein [Planctomycetota bacterium]